MLLVAKFANKKSHKKTEWLKPQQMGTHLRVLSESYPMKVSAIAYLKAEKLLKPWHKGSHLRVLSKRFPMNTNMTGFGWFSKVFASLWFGQSLEGLNSVPLQRH